MTDLGADLEGVKVPVLPEAALRFCGGMNIGLSEADTVEGCGRVEAILGSSLSSKAVNEFPLQFSQYLERVPH